MKIGKRSRGGEMCWKRRKTDVRKMEKIEAGERRANLV
jgi:hypothetical protein